MLTINIDLNEMRAVAKLADMAVRAAGLEAARIAIPLLDGLQAKVDAAEAPPQAGEPASKTATCDADQGEIERPLV